MRKATHKDKPRIVDLLSRSFDANHSVNYLVHQDAHRLKRIKELMAYSFEVCCRFGEVYISEDHHACALILYPHKKQATFKSSLLDINLVINCIGFFNLTKAFKRESEIKRIQPKEQKYYLWFIGVDIDHQSLGTGSKLMEELIKDSEKQGLPIYLETSTLRNLSWYERFGFEIYHRMDLSYRLYFLKRPVKSLRYGEGF